MLAFKNELGGNHMPITKESLFEQLHIDDLGLDQVLERTKKLIHEGNVHRLLVKDAQGTTLIEVPLTVGVVGAVLVPVWAAIAAIAAIVADATIVVEKRSPTGGDENVDASTPPAGVSA
jgi:hypothetical protein